MAGFLNRGVLLCVLVAGTTYTTVAEEVCGAADSQSCKLKEAVVGTDATESLGLLQHKAGAKDAAVQKEQKKAPKSLPDPDDVWNQLKGAVNIDSIEDKLNSASDSSVIGDLKDKLSDLKEAFPEASKIKDKFSDDWDKITDGVNLDDLKEKLSKAQSSGSDGIVSELQGKVSELEGELLSLRQIGKQRLGRHEVGVVVQVGLSLQRLAWAQRLVRQDEGHTFEVQG